MANSSRSISQAMVRMHQHMPYPPASAVPNDTEGAWTRLPEGSSRNTCARMPRRAIVADESSEGAPSIGRRSSGTAPEQHRIQPSTAPSPAGSKSTLAKR